MGSSTWCFHFITLANPAKKILDQWRDALQLFAPKLWPLPDNTKVADLSNLMGGADFTSLVISRHPFSRIASVYYQKLIDLGQSSWSPITERIIKKFRSEEKKLEAEQALEDGKTFKYFETAQDHKRVLEGDKGKNTGGMGAISPVPFAGLP